MDLLRGPPLLDSSRLSGAGWFLSFLAVLLPCGGGVQQWRSKLVSGPVAVVSICRALCYGLAAFPGSLTARHGKRVSLNGSLAVFMVQHMENVYPGSNILVVTVTDEESKWVEEQGDDETKAEAMVVPRKMFGDGIPEAEQILVPKWWSNRFQRGSYSDYPNFVDKMHFSDIKAPIGPVYFTGEHTSEKFNGFVHGAYLSGIDTANMVVESMKKKKLLHEENGLYSSCHRCTFQRDQSRLDRSNKLVLVWR